MAQKTKEHFKYKIIAHIVKLHLNKNLNFETKVTWKRNVNKAQTETVTHQNCESIFDQALQLQLNMVFNHAEGKFQSKLTEFCIVVVYQGKIKSGGSVKYDASQVVNQNYSNESVKLNLNNCPDPQAYIQILFNYEVLGDVPRSLFNQLSMLNPSGFENDLSQIDFKEDENDRESLGEVRRTSVQSQKQNIEDMPLKEKEIEKINNILDKFESVSRRLSSKPKSFFCEDTNFTKNEIQDISAILTPQQQKLQQRVAQLQNQLELKKAMLDDYQLKWQEATRKIQEMTIKLEMSADKIEQLESNTKVNKIDLALAESQQKYKQLYQEALAQIQTLNNRQTPSLNFSKQSRNFNTILQEVQQVNEFPEFQMDDPPSNNNNNKQNNELAEVLERQNVQLQTKIASMSHNMAQLFNAAYQYGGAKLLDHLQSSIGLIEQDS